MAQNPVSADGARQPGAMSQDRLIVAAASRPYPGESLNGDGWQVDWHADRCRISIVDGLGHGPAAAEATMAALSALAARPELSPDDSLRTCHTALAGTRGAVISIAAIDLQAAELVYAGVGNAEACVLSNGRWERLIAHRGIVGATMPHLRTFSHALGEDWMLVMFTDGIRSRFQFDELPDLARADPRALAERILQTWSRDTDDATVIVARAV